MTKLPITSSQILWEQCNEGWLKYRRASCHSGSSGRLKGAKIDGRSHVHLLSKASLIYGSEKKSLLIAPESHFKMSYLFLSVDDTDSFVLKLSYVPLGHGQTILENLHAQHIQQGRNKILLGQVNTQVSCGIQVIERDFCKGQMYLISLKTVQRF